MVDFQSIKNYLPIISPPAVIQKQDQIDMDMKTVLLRGAVTLAASTVLSYALSAAYGYATTGASSYGAFSAFPWVASLAVLVKENARVITLKSEALCKAYIQADHPSKALMNEVLDLSVTLDELLKTPEGRASLKKTNEDGQDLFTLLSLKRNFGLTDVVNCSQLIGSNIWSNREIFTASGILSPDVSLIVVLRNLGMLQTLAKLNKFKVDDLSIDDRVAVWKRYDLDKEIVDTFRCRDAIVQKYNESGLSSFSHHLDLLDPQIFQKLIDTKADFLKKDKNGHSLLYWTAAHFARRKDGRFEQFRSAFNATSFTPEEKSKFLTEIPDNRLLNCIEMGLVKEGDIFTEHQNEEIAALLKKAFSNV